VSSFASIFRSNAVGPDPLVTVPTSVTFFDVSKLGASVMRGEPMPAQ